MNGDGRWTVSFPERVKIMHHVDIPKLIRSKHDLTACVSGFVRPRIHAGFMQDSTFHKDNKDTYVQTRGCFDRPVCLST